MSLMVIELYDALIAAGSPDDKARAAAGALTAPDTRLLTIEENITNIRLDMTSIKSDLRTLKYLVGIGLTTLLIPLIIPMVMAGLSVMLKLIK